MKALKKALELQHERSLVLIKPDGVLRGLIGQVLERFERAGLKVVGMKLLLPTRERLDGHFPKDEGWIKGMGLKTLETYVQYGMDPVEIFSSDDPLAIGRRILEWNYRYLTAGPVVALVLEGVHAIDTVRKMIGSTLPYQAAPGTIRSDFSINAPDIANIVGSACKNIVHASGNQTEAAAEIANWFENGELVNYQRADEFLHFLLGENTTEHNGGTT